MKLLIDGVRYHLGAGSGASPLDAGYGLLRADTIVATTDDELVLTPAAHFSLSVGAKETDGPIADLDLAPGRYPAAVRIGGRELERAVTLLLVHPSSICHRFGARYGSLEYDLPMVTGRETTAPWSTQWKTNEVADIVVDFDAPYKFVLWRGMAFAPSWAMDNVMTCNFFAETVEPGVFRDCCEMMSDRECRYVHARVIHSTDARVVLHWRYPLVDTAYAICRDQWMDEMYFVYPDGVAVRNVTLYLDHEDEDAWYTSPETGRRVPCPMGIDLPGKRTFNDTEFITVNPPGSVSEDNTPPDALTLLDGHRFAYTYRWPSPPDVRRGDLPRLDEYIFRMNYLCRPGVFLASPSTGLQWKVHGDEGMCYQPGARVEDDRWSNVPIPGLFTDFIHWPITRGYGTTALTDPAHYHDRPTHTFLGHANAEPVEVKESGAATWCWLCGIAPEDEAALRSRVNNWLHPPPIAGARYDARQAAYVVDDGGPEVTLSLDADRPVVRPTFVLRGWDRPDAQVTMRGCSTKGVALGVERTLHGVQTVVTTRGNLEPGTRVSVRV